MGSQPPRPTLTLEVLQTDGSSAKDAPGKPAVPPLFLVFWAKRGLLARLLATKLFIHPRCMRRSRASAAAPSSSTSRSRLG